MDCKIILCTIITHFIFTLMSQQGFTQLSQSHLICWSPWAAQLERCSEINSKPEQNPSCELVLVWDVFIIIIMLLLWAAHRRVRVKQPAWCDLLHENYHNNAKLWKEAEGDTYKWNSNERWPQAQSSCHNIQNNNKWKPLKSFSLNRHTSLCKE